MRSFLARAVVFWLYAVALAVVTFSRYLRRRRPLPADRPLKVLVTGTFYNRGWLRAHAKPIVGASRVESLVVVTDAPLDPLARTTYNCPAPWLARLLTRAPARLVQVGLAAWSCDSDVLVGYHIMPNALICLVVAALLGRRAVFQMTGGPAQVVGGGAQSENVLLRRIGEGSPSLEKLLMRLVRRFDAVVVRGRRAASFLAERGLDDRVFVIPAGIDSAEFRPRHQDRPHDVIFVGRLTPVKGCDLLREVLIALVKRRPGTRAVVVGDGYMRESLGAAFASAGVGESIDMPGQRDDVHEWLARSRVFILTSPDEGLSIALLEAMAAGAVPVVSDVGELRDVVLTGETGYLVPSRRAADYVERLVEILDDEALESRLSRRAREVALGHAGLEAVSASWDGLLGQLASAGSSWPAG